MSQFNYIGAGNPTNIPAPANSPAEYLDTANNAQWFSTPASGGWKPDTTVIAGNEVTAQAANNADVLTYTAPQTGIFQIAAYTVSTNTPTAGTLPSVQVTYTEADTGNSTTATITPTVASVSASGVVSTGTGGIRAKVGTTITIATTGYAAGSGTALTYNSTVRVSYLG
jgi:hypothetical protein